MPKTNTHNFKGLHDWFAAFYGGEQVDSRGNKRTWSDADLDQIVANTQRRIDKSIFNGAPMVIGHPDAAAPAYGWISKIKRVGSELSVKGDRLQDAFAEGVKNGLWPNRSISVGKDKDGYYLRHLGFLGAAPPAIDGMDSIYSASEDEHFDYSLDSTTPNIMSRTFRRLRDFLIEKYGVEETDKVLPDYELDNLAEHVNRLRDEGSDTPLFSKQPPTGDDTMSEFTQTEMDAAIAKAKTEAALEAQEAAQVDFAQKQQESDAKLKAETNKRLGVEFKAAIDSLVDEGKLLPAQTEGMAEFMLQLSDADEAHFEFSAGEKDKEQTIKKSPLVWFQDFTAAIGKQIDASEIGGNDVDSSNGSDFSMPNADVNAERLELHNKASDYMNAHEGVSYIDAVRAVERQAA